MMVKISQWLNWFLHSVHWPKTDNEVTTDQFMFQGVSQHIKTLN